MRIKKQHFLYTLLFFAAGIFSFSMPNYVSAATVTKIKNFDYTNNEQNFIAPVSGYYQLEAWGAQGGQSGGYGAYSTGVTYLNKNDKLYINVGGYPGTSLTGGYNGGGTGGSGKQTGAGGGGATHMAKLSGTLPNLSANISSILIIAAGGGGQGSDSKFKGSHGGGYLGVNGYDTYYETVGYKGYSGTGASLSKPGYSMQASNANCGRGSFGKGGNYCNLTYGGFGGGAGYFGGGGSPRGSHGGAGGGSSYIGSNSLLSYGNITKSTYCYNCTEDTSASTKTIKTSKVSSTATANYAKSSHGYARVTLVANDDGRIETLTFAKGKLIPDFNPDVYSYQISFGSEDSYVDVSATPIFAESTISGTGKVGIQKGTNDLLITSTSEAGNVFTYIIHTTRAPSSYKYLEDIKIDGTTIEGFDPTKLKYEINVPYNQEVLDLEIVKGRFSQEVILPNNYDLHTGKNKFTIPVTAEDGSSAIEYELIVNREHSTKLKSLAFNNFELLPSFEPDNTSYTLKIMANTMSVSLSATAYDEEATIKTEGFGYIRSTSVGKIIVTEPNCKPTVYEVTLEKQSSDLVLTYDFPYTGDIETFTAPANGYYRLETWGAQGGGNGGFGAYSTGAVYLKEGTKLYITVGGAGAKYAGGYNGGGNGGTSSTQWGHGGGGATHISTIPALLTNLASDRNAILLVAAGGGGGGSNLNQNLNGHGGGYVGNNGYDTYTNSYRGYNGTGGSLTGGGGCPTGSSSCGRGSFGKGGNYCSMGYGGTGGGGGYYGGGGGNRGHGAGGGGSSYIGSSALVSYDTVTKATYCYGCSTSGSESNRSVSINNVSSNPTRNYAKRGSGYARISTLRFPSENNFLSSLNITATNMITGETNLKNYSPNFGIEIDDYSVTLNPNETSITFLAKAEDIAAEIDGIGTHDVPAGTTDFKIKVKAESGAIRTITVHVTRPASNDANPTNIEVNGLVDSLCSTNPDYCVLKPAIFNPNTKEYEVTVPSKIKQVWFDVTKAHPYQTVTGDGKVTLNAGENDFTIKVTSEDGVTSNEYHYKIIRNMAGNTDLLKLEILDPAIDIHFQPEIMEYYFSVPNEYTSIEKMNIVPEDPNAEYFVSGNVDFEVGTNQVTITVTSTNGETGVYILNVYREKNENVYLSRLEVKHNAITYELLPEFNKINTGTYSVTVPNDVDNADVIAVAEASTTSIFGNQNYPLQVGINRIQIITTSQTGTVETYYLEITREKNNNVDLASLELSHEDKIYTLDPEFNKDNLTYSTEVEEGVSEITITAIPEVSTTEVKYLDNNQLKVGANLKRIMTIAEDGSSRVYNVIINRPANNDNYLEDIVLSEGTLHPEFDRNGSIYSVTVPNEVSKINVTGIKSNPLSKVNGNGEYALAVGKNEVLLSVISETGDIRIYQIMITREASSDATLSIITTSEGVILPEPGTLKYTITIPSTVNQIDVYGTPTVKTTQVIGNGNYKVEGKESIITLTTIAEDKTSLTYTIEVVKEKSKNNLLKYLLMEEGNITPEFSPSIDHYIVTVPYDIQKGTFHVETEQADASYEITGSENFEVGENTVNIHVTAENGDTKDYVVVVTRQEDFTNSDYLATLAVDRGTLSPQFSKEEQYYEVTVPNDVSSIGVSAVPEDGNATVTGRGTYNLETGKNTILVRVVSAEGKIRDYQIVVTREESNEARLDTLTLNGDMLSPNFNKDTFLYSVTTTNNSLEFNKIIPVNEKATYEVIGNNFSENKTYSVIIRVTAPDKLTTKDYTIEVTKEPSKNNNLESLSVLGYTLDPEFNKATTLYRVTVPNEMNSVMIEAIPEDDKATVSGAGPKLLSVGENQIVIEVSSESGNKKAYTILITKEESTNNHLSDLIVHNGMMNPEFNNHISTYDVVVDYEEESLDLTVIPEDDKATFEVMNNTLVVGNNVVEIIITAQDGTQNKVTLNVTRKGISSALLEELKAKNYPFEFNPHITHYDLLVNYETDALDLTIVPKDSHATYVVTGNENLSVGGSIITIEVTASDGVTKETYTINVTKQKYATTFLSYLYTSEGDVTPDFEKTKMEYSIDVANNVKTIELFGEAADKSATVTGLGSHDLAVGKNKFEIVVMAKNGVKRTYSITVNRAMSLNNSLTELVVKNGFITYDLTPEFDSDTTDYTVTVPVGTLSVLIDGKAEESATVTGLGEKELKVGENKFSILVTSENGNEKTYNITITREASNNNHLIQLIPSTGVLKPEFSYEGTNYSIDLDSSASVLSFDVITEDANATVSGEEARVIPDGVSTREIIILAEDGTPRTITITVTKTREDNAKLKSLSVTNYPFDETFDPDTFLYHIHVPNEKKYLTADEVIAVAEDEDAVITKTGTLMLLTNRDNEYLVTVTAKDGFTKQIYKIVITREQGSSVLLNSLVVKKGFLSPIFQPEQQEYTWTVPKSITSVTKDDVVVTSEDVNAVITKTENLEIIKGAENKFKVKVTSEDGSTSKEYVLNVVMDEESDTTLKSLVIDKGYYEPEFDPNTHTYDVYEYADTNEINITATPNDSTSVVTSGNGPLTLIGSEMKHEIIVTAENGTTDVYILNIHKTILNDKGLKNLGLNGLNEEICFEGICTLSKEFDTETLEYQITVPLSYTTLDILAEKMNEQQTVKYFIGEEEITNGYSLPMGSTEVLVNVYDGTGVLTRTYELTINRVDTLENKLLTLEASIGEFDKEFNPDDNNYILSLPLKTNKVTLSGTASPYSTIVGLGEVTVTEKELVHSILVTLPNGDVNTYTITIKRGFSDDTRLESLIPSIGTLDYTNDTLEYEMEVPDEIEMISFVATPMDPDATITGTDITNLEYGENEIHILVVAEDQTSKREIIIKVIRKKNLIAIIPSEEKIVLDQEEVKTISYTLDPVDTSYADVEWKSLDESIATVDTSGNIKGVGYGKTEIQIISKQDANIIGTIKVAVIHKKITSSIYEVVHYTEEEIQTNPTYENYMIGLEPKTKLTSFKKKLDNEEEMIHVYNLKEEEINEKTNIGTSFKIKLIYEEEVLDEVIIIVRGDLNGDGLITIADNMTIKNFINKDRAFSFIEKKAGDANKDNKITVADTMRIKNFINKDISSVN